MPITSQRIAELIAQQQQSDIQIASVDVLKILLIESLTPMQAAILDGLNSSTQPVTSDTLITELQLPRHYVLRSLTELEDLNLIERNIKDGQFYYHTT